MKKFLVSLVLLLGLAFVTVGCGDKEKKEAPPADDKTVQQDAPKDHPAH